MPGFEKYSENGLIAATALNQLLNSNEGKNVRVLDATYVLPGSSLHPAQGYLMQHIPGAQFFDIEEIADHANPLPHMVPPAAQFERQIGALGISNETPVVVYDQSGLYMASARAWWMLRVFGHTKVCVLDGGLPAWQEAGLALANGEEAAPPHAIFKANPQPFLVAHKEEILDALDANDALILDARPAERFAGHAPEPRPGMRAGHIPGSRNIPFGSLIEPRDRTLRDKDTMDMLFAAHGANAAPRIITTCGSGVTACVLALGLFRSGRKDVSVYDGSWSEWGQGESGTPIANLHS